MDKPMNETTDVPQFPREISPGIFWLNYCMGTSPKTPELHLHLSIFLVIGSEKTFLIDTSLPTMWRGIEPQLREALAGRKLDYIFVTHPELPHSAGLPNLMEQFPEATLIGDMRDYHLFFPEYIDRSQNVVPGEKLSLGDRSITFIDAAIKDLPGTLWAYEDVTQTMFVCDGFSLTHDGDENIDPVDVGRELRDLEDDEPVHFEGECAMLTSELPSVNIKSASLIIERALYWSRFVKPDLLFGDVRKLFEDYPPKLIAPSHGNVIDNIPEIEKMVIEAHELAYARATEVAG